MSIPSGTDYPACMDWPVPAEPVTDMRGLFDWHDGRCALCGEPPAGRASWLRVLVLDHSHRNGHVRGYLCRSCNTREGSTVRFVPQLVRWRSGWNPATLLGIDERYDYGHEWSQGSFAKDS